MPSLLREVKVVNGVETCWRYCTIVLLLISLHSKYGFDLSFLVRIDNSLSQVNQPKHLSDCEYLFSHHISLAHAPRQGHFP